MIEGPEFAARISAWGLRRVPTRIRRRNSNFYAIAIDTVSVTHCSPADSQKHLPTHVGLVAYKSRSEPVRRVHARPMPCPMKGWRAGQSHVLNWIASRLRVSRARCPLDKWPWGGISSWFPFVPTSTSNCTTQVANAAPGRKLCRVRAA